MDHDRLWRVADIARAGRRLSVEDAAFIRDTVPEELGSVSGKALPKSIRHPGGFSVSGAPVGAFLRSALLIAGQKVFGKRYEGSVFYEGVERDLAFGIMRSHFHHGYPKGTHCCTQCTLAVYPALKAGTMRWFDCGELAADVRKVIEKRQWRFATAPNPKMLAWSLGGPAE
jgi:hypothetical protein